MKLTEQLKLLCEEIWNPENTLDIPRHEMPQIDMEHLDTFLNYLKDVECDYERCNKLPEQLYPSQNELDTDKADKIWNDGNAFESPIIISQDHYVLDGHHRWLAVKRNAPDKKLECIMMGPNALECLDVMHDFEHSKKIDIEDNLVKE